MKCLKTLIVPMLKIILKIKKEKKTLQSFKALDKSRNKVAKASREMI